MTPTEVVAHFGSVRAVTEALGITQQAYSRWLQQGRVPRGRQYELQILTGGRLQAERPTKKTA